VWLGNAWATSAPSRACFEHPEVAHFHPPFPSTVVKLEHRPVFRLARCSAAFGFSRQKRVHDPTCATLDDAVSLDRNFWVLLRPPRGRPRFNHAQPRQVAVTNHLRRKVPLHCSSSRWSRSSRPFSGKDGPARKTRFTEARDGKSMRSVPRRLKIFAISTAGPAPDRIGSCHTRGPWLNFLGQGAQGRAMRDPADTRSSSCIDCGIFG